ncbi:MAG: YceD family protein, partial [Candidatus Bipolaricaulaceae bacterium]
MRFDLDAMRAAPGKVFHVEGEEQLTTLNWRGEEVRVEGPVHAEASAFYVGSENQVVLTVHVRGRVHRACSRCLADVVENVDKEEELEVFPDEIQGKYLELRPFIEAG